MKQEPLIPRTPLTFNDVCPEPFPTCACGHRQGDHLSSGAGWPHPSVFGLCVVPGCGCREFTDETRAA